MKSSLLILYFCLVNQMCFSQHNTTDTIKTSSIKLSKNALYFEFMGTSTTMLSIHYDRILCLLNKGYVSIETGFGYYPKFNSLNQNIGVPLYLNYTNRLLKKNHLEIGLGLTYSNGTFQGGGIPFVESYESLEAIYASLKLGYKYQSPLKGLSFRATATPLIKIVQLSNYNPSESLFLPLIGLSAGYSF